MIRSAFRVMWAFSRSMPNGSEHGERRESQNSTASLNDSKAGIPSTCPSTQEFTYGKAVRRFYSLQITPLCWTITLRGPPWQVPSWPLANRGRLIRNSGTWSTGTKRREKSGSLSLVFHPKALGASSTSLVIISLHHASGRTLATPPLSQARALRHRASTILRCFMAPLAPERPALLKKFARHLDGL